MPFKIHMSTRMRIGAPMICLESKGFFRDKRSPRGTRTILDAGYVFLFTILARTGHALVDSTPTLRRMRVAFLACLLACSHAQAAEIPKSKWNVMKNPASHGWFPEKLKDALDFASASGSSALMIVEDGFIVGQTGDTAQKISSYCKVIPERPILTKK